MQSFKGIPCMVFLKQQCVDSYKSHPSLLWPMKSVWWWLCLKRPYALPVFSYDLAVSGMLLGVKLQTVECSPHPSTSWSVWCPDSMKTQQPGNIALYKSWMSKATTTVLSPTVLTVDEREITLNHLLRGHNWQIVHSLPLIKCLLAKRITLLLLL